MWDCVVRSLCIAEGWGARRRVCERGWFGSLGGGVWSVVGGGLVYPFGLLDCWGEEVMECFVPDRWCKGVVVGGWWEGAVEAAVDLVLNGGGAVE